MWTILKQFFNLFFVTDQLNDAELNRLIKETMEMRKNNKSLSPGSEEAKKRQEYDSTADNVNFINYHLSLFTYLVALTLLNLPSVIAWFKNFALVSNIRQFINLNSKLSRFFLHSVTLTPWKWIRPLYQPLLRWLRCP